jgi:hypothetical protein
MKKMGILQAYQNHYRTWRESWFPQVDPQLALNPLHPLGSTPSILKHDLIDVIPNILRFCLILRIAVQKTDDLL